MQKKKEHWNKRQLYVLASEAPMCYFAAVQNGLYAVFLLALSLGLFYAAEQISVCFRSEQANRYDLKGAAAGGIFFITLSIESEWYVIVIGAFLYFITRLILKGDKSFLAALFARSLLGITVPTFFYTSSFLPQQRLYYGMEVRLESLFFGHAGGYLGEICTAVILIGFAFLLFDRLYAVFFASGAVLSGFPILFLFGASSFQAESAFAGILMGHFLFPVLIVSSELSFFWETRHTASKKICAAGLAGICMGGTGALFLIAGNLIYPAFLLTEPILVLISKRKDKNPEERGEMQNDECREK